MANSPAIPEKPADAARGHLRRGLLSLLALGATIAVGLYVISRRDVAPEAPGDPELVRSLPRMNASTGYATSHECRECHREEYASWHASYHRKMTQVAGPDSILGPFDGTEIRDAGQVHRLLRKGNEFWVETAKEGFPLPSEEESPVSRRVVMTTGSHHMQVYWTTGGNGNRLRELPMIYIRDESPGKSRWAPLEASYLSPSPPGAADQTCWNRDCILCHATGGRPGTDANAMTANTKVGEFGIACEACHGPAERHVRVHRQHTANRQAEGPPTEKDQAIVNPARLHPERSAQVCGHCHALASFITDQLIEDFFLSGSAYRPGDDLLQTRMTVLPAHMTEEQIEAHRQYNPYFDGSYWPDGMVRVAGREYNGLLESTCYQKGGMTCLSCHSMHHSNPDDQLAAIGQTNEACYQCHASYRDKLIGHTHHLADSTGSQCYNCHMPHTTYGLFKAIRSHQISSPNVAVTRATGRPTACNLCHLDQPLAWTDKNLSEWYGQPFNELNEEQQSYSAAGLLLIKGNSVERVLLGWIAGWQPALGASKRDWLVPVLATLLDDPSPVVRLSASRSLDRVDHRYALDYDFVAPADKLRQFRRRIIDLWNASADAPREKPLRRLFVDDDGQFDEDRVQALIGERDDRSLRVRE